MRRIKYYIHRDGIQKFPFYSESYNIHPLGTKRYANFGCEINAARYHAHDLPADGYPYNLEYSYD